MDLVVDGRRAAARKGLVTKPCRLPSGIQGSARESTGRDPGRAVRWLADALFRRGHAPTPPGIPRVRRGTGSMKPRHGEDDAAAPKGEAAPAEGDHPNRTYEWLVPGGATARTLEESGQGDGVAGAPRAVPG